MPENERPLQRHRTSRQWRKNAARLLIFLIVLTLEAAFNVGILLGRLRWKDDVAWVRPVFLIMGATLLVLLWALYRQTRRVMYEYLQDSEERLPEE